MKKITASTRVEVSSTRYPDGRKNAFTLAEVLITLGIIGVVAAMTMPTLMNSTQGAQYKAAYKKSLSALSQAVTLNVALDEWNFADLSAKKEDGKPDVADGTYNMTKLLSSRMNVVRTEVGTNVKLSDGTTAYTAGNEAAKSGVKTAPAIDSTNTTLFFNDGIMFSYPTAAAGCTNVSPTGAQGQFSKTKNPTCFGFVDVNGIKGPNKVVKCDNNITTGGTCTVNNPTDVYPVMFYDQSVLPATDAARAVLYGK